MTQLTPNTITGLPLSCITPDPEQPRKHIDPDKLKGLAHSLKTAGQQEPITVRPNPDKAGHYLIVHGERRYTAARQAKLKTLDARLENLKEQNPDNQDWARLVYQMVDNMEREDLNPIDLARTFKQMRENYEGADGKEMTSEQIHEELKKYGLSTPPSASNIRNMMRLLDLPDWASDYIRAGKLTAKHGRVLLPVSKLAGVVERAKRYIDEQINEEQPISSTDLAETIDMLCADCYPTITENAYITEHVPLDVQAKGSSALYDLKNMNNEERDQLGIITIDDGYGRKYNYVTNRTAHEKKQAEVVEQIKQKRAAAEARKQKKEAQKKDTGTNTPAEKAPNIEPKQQGLDQHYNKWLGLTLLNTLQEIDHTETLVDQLIAWCAFKQPDSVENYVDNTVGHAAYLCTDEAEFQLYQGAGLYTLQHFLHCKDPLSTTNTELLLRYALDHMDLQHRCYLASHLGLDISALFRIDLNYLDLYTKPGLLALCDKADVIECKLDKKPVSDLKLFIAENFKEKIGCPEHILDLHEEAMGMYHEMVEDTMNEIAAIEKDEQKKVA